MQCVIEVGRYHWMDCVISTKRAAVRPSSGKVLGLPVIRIISRLVICEFLCTRPQCKEGRTPGKSNTVKSIMC